jgi:hypothetical protein
MTARSAPAELAEPKSKRTPSRPTCFEFQTLHGILPGKRFSEILQRRRMHVPRGRRMRLIFGQPCDDLLGARVKWLAYHRCNGNYQQTNLPNQAPACSVCCLITTYACIQMHHHEVLYFCFSFLRIMMIRVARIHQPIRHHSVHVVDRNRENTGRILKQGFYWRDILSFSYFLLRFCLVLPDCAVLHYTGAKKSNHPCTIQPPIHILRIKKRLDHSNPRSGHSKRNHNLTPEPKP